MSTTGTPKTDAELDSEIDDLLEIIGIQVRSMGRKAKVRAIKMLRALQGMLELLEPQ